MSKSKPRHKSTSVTVDGVTYDTIRDACEAFNILYLTFRHRRSRGMSVEDSLKKPVSPRYTDPVEVFGVTHKDLDTACRYLRLNRKIVRDLVSSGMTPAQAILSEFDSKKDKPLRVGDKRYNNVADACKALGVPLQTVYSRMESGYTPKEALTVPEKTNVSRGPIRINGKIFYSIADVCRHFNLKYNAVILRVREGYSVESAVSDYDKYAKNRGSEVTVDGEVYESLSDACRKRNKNISTVRQRISKGETPDEAFDVINPPLVKNGKTQHRSKRVGHVTVGGVKYKTLREACNVLGVKYSTIRGRLALGYSYEDSFFNDFSKTSGDKQFEHGGVVYDSLKTACTAFGLPYTSTSKALREGKTLDSIIENRERKLAERLKPEPFTANGVVYDSLGIACDVYRVAPHAVRSRLSRGWTSEQALNLADSTEEANNGIRVIYNGVEYASLLKACKALRVSYPTVYARYKKGQELDTIFDMLIHEITGEMK